MLTPREVRIRRALLLAAQAIGPTFLLPEDLLRAEAARLVVPAPSTTELDVQLGRADAARQLLSLESDEGRKWKIAEAGRAWLLEHP